MQTREIRRRALGMQKRLERVFDDASKLLDEMRDDESAHLLNEILQHATDSAAAASRLASHLNPGEWS